MQPYSTCVRLEFQTVIMPMRWVCVGVMGVAPPPDQQLEAGRPLGVVSTGPPNINGGNMDNRHMCEGSTAYYPVFVPGALFSCGDGHAAQGDGEVSGKVRAKRLLRGCSMP